jgi:hypothetical protein
MRLVSKIRPTVEIYGVEERCMSWVCGAVLLKRRLIGGFISGFYAQIKLSCEKLISRIRYFFH